MALPSWPAGLPDLVPLVGSGGTDALYTPPQATEFDDGPPRVRRRQLTDSTARKISLRLTRAQLVAFLAFVRTDLNMGARRFTASVRVPSGRLEPRTCRIEGAVSERDDGSTSLVAFTLVVQDW